MALGSSFHHSGSLTGRRGLSGGSDTWGSNPALGRLKSQGSDPKVGGTPASDDVWGWGSDNGGADSSSLWGSAAAILPAVASMGLSTRGLQGGAGKRAHAD